MGYKWEDFEKKEETIFVIEVGKKGSGNYFSGLSYSNRIKSLLLDSAKKWDTLEKANIQIESIRAIGKKTPLRVLEKKVYRLYHYTVEFDYWRSDSDVTINKKVSYYYGDNINEFFFSNYYPTEKEAILAYKNNFETAKSDMHAEVKKYIKIRNFMKKHHPEFQIESWLK